MTFEEFLPLARTMIQLIYQNSDPSPYPWVELDSPKAGGLFWFNKFTSEVSMYPPSARDVSVVRKQNLLATIITITLAGK